MTVFLLIVQVHGSTSAIGTSCRQQAPQPFLQEKKGEKKGDATHFVPFPPFSAMPWKRSRIHSGPGLSAGAQTERRGDAGPMSVLLRGWDSPAAFFWSTDG